MENAYAIPVVVKDLLLRSTDEHKVVDYFLTKTSQIHITPKVRLKCQFGCEAYGRRKLCPPSESLTPQECRDYLGDYDRAIIVRFPPIVDEDAARARQALLLELEWAAMRSNCPFALAVFPTHCRQCAECAGEGPCTNRVRARPSTTALCIDILGTLALHNRPQFILSSPHDTPGRDGPASPEFYYVGLLFLD